MPETDANRWAAGDAIARVRSARASQKVGAAGGGFPPFRLAALFWLTVFLAGCAVRPPLPGPEPRPAITELGYTIQAGAFARMDNAVGLAERLQDRGLDATFFQDGDQLFKVRFGDFTTRDAAESHARILVENGVIEDYFIVAPQQQAAAQRRVMGEPWVRAQVVKTARGFLGLPYRWGGASASTGFDCSGLAMTAYRLNGYTLPRTSRQQYDQGDPVSRGSLAPADLVFFATGARNKVSHVGIYIGGGRFIHAPGKGKTIRTDDLSDHYFRRRFLGARSFL